MGLKAVKGADGEIVYTFENDAGQDSPRIPPPAPTEIELLREQNVALESLISQTSSDFSLFMDFFFEMNPNLA